MASAALEILKANEAEILAGWLAELQASGWGDSGRFSEGDWKGQAREMFSLVAACASSGGDLDSAAAAPLREFLQSLSRTMAVRGANSSQTATFVFSLKKPVFESLRHVYGQDAKLLADAIWSTSEMIDRMGLFTVSTFQKTREEIINRQQEEMLELSTPVVALWDGVLGLPLIGTLDSARTQVVMENLLQRIVETGAQIAIIDITGVPTVDTLVAQHLLKTVAAARLMGADCIISGIRPQIAQTIVHLGVELNTVATKATLADAFALALKRSGLSVVRASAGS
jgi:rsbT co-antagonist protein RsbR